MPSWYFSNQVRLLFWLVNDHHHHIQIFQCHARDLTKTTVHKQCATSMDGSVYLSEETCYKYFCVWVDFLVWKLCLGYVLFSLCFFIFNCWGTFIVCNWHMDPLSLLPLSEKARFPVHFLRNRDILKLMPSPWSSIMTLWTLITMTFSYDLWTLIKMAFTYDPALEIHLGKYSYMCLSDHNLIRSNSAKAYRSSGVALCQGVGVSSVRGWSEFCQGLEWVLLEGLELVLWMCWSGFDQEQRVDSDMWWHWVITLV